jgi:hypothetical protein
MPKIFFCYRRDDSTHQAGRIFDQLGLRFGKAELFKDVDSMPLGRDFRRVLSERVAQCDVLLALIGDTWLTAANSQGKRRIDDPGDIVRIEIESALRRRIPVVPVLVGNAPIPRDSELPTGLRELPFLQGIPVRPDPDFHNDVDRLIAGIIDIVGPGLPPAGPAPAGAPPVSSSSVDWPTIERVAAFPGKARTYLDRVLRTTPGAPSPPRRRETPPPSLPAGRTVRVGILESGNATYVNEIDRALLANLKPRLESQRARLVQSDDCVEWGDENQWPTTVDRLMTRGRDGFRFLVAIGTQAAVALHRTLGPDFGKVPTLLLGITYPRINGLVDSEHYRCETRQLACIRYGCGLDAVASLLYHRIFPGRKLCFVYQANIPQDEMAQMELSTTRLAREGVLRLHRLDRRLKAEDLEDEETVYFSWYTFTRLFHDAEFSILRNRLTVSIMQDNVRDGAASVGVGTDHDWIGNRGAELIAEHEAAPEGEKPDWGALEVTVSPLVYWLNLGLAKAKGIEFSQAAREGAREIYE